MATWSNDFDADGPSYPSGWADQTETDGTVGPSTSAELNGVGGGYGVRSVTTTDTGIATAKRSVTNSGTNIWSLSSKVRVNSKTTGASGQAIILQFWSSTWAGGLNVAWIEHLNGTGYRLNFYERNTFGATRPATLTTQFSDNTTYDVELVIDKTTSPWEVRCYINGTLDTTTQDAASGSNGIAHNSTEARVGAQRLAGSSGGWSVDYDIVAFNESVQAGSGITGTGAITITVPSLAGSGTYTPPDITGTGAITIAVPSLAGSGSFDSGAPAAPRVGMRPIRHGARRWV